LSLALTFFVIRKHLLYKVLVSIVKTTRQRTALVAYSASYKRFWYIVQVLAMVQVIRFFNLLVLWHRGCLYY